MFLAEKEKNMTKNFDNTQLPGLLTVEQVAKWLDRTPKAIYALVYRGKIPGVRRIGKRIYFLQKILLSWIE